MKKQISFSLYWTPPEVVPTSPYNETLAILDSGLQLQYLPSGAYYDLILRRDCPRSLVATPYTFCCTSDLFHRYLKNCSYGPLLEWCMAGPVTSQDSYVRQLHSQFSDFGGVPPFLQCTIYVGLSRLSVFKRFQGKLRIGQRNARGPYSLVQAIIVAPPFSSSLGFLPRICGVEP